jgi:hypothetical protein
LPEQKTLARDENSTIGVVSWHPTYEEMDPDVPTRSILHGVFKANHEDKSSFWVRNGEKNLTHSIRDPFLEPKVDKPATETTQAVGRRLYRYQFGQLPLLSLP